MWEERACTQKSRGSSQAALPGRPSHGAQWLGRAPSRRPDVDAPTENSLPRGSSRGYSIRRPEPQFLPSAFGRIHDSDAPISAGSMHVEGQRGLRVPSEEMFRAAQTAAEFGRSGAALISGESKPQDRFEHRAETMCWASEKRE